MVAELHSQYGHTTNVILATLHMWITCNKYCFTAVSMHQQLAMQCSYGYYLFIPQVNIGDLGFQYFQLHVRDFTKREKLNASLPQFNVSFNRGHQSMFKDFSIDFRVEVESDGDVGLQKCFKYSMKILASN